ncbi:MAG TPA: CHAD domain-containing protein [Burkholderiales bacterium]
MPQETELKLRLPPEALPRLRGMVLPGAVPGARAVSERLHSTYFDTADSLLRRNGVALRLRRTRRGWVQTLKGGGAAGAGLHQRAEWECRVAGPQLELDRLPGPASVLLLPAEVREALRPVFTTEFGRRRRMLRFEGGDEVEFCVDRGEVRAEHASSPICEIELELKSGSPTRLFDVGRALLRELPVRLESASKAERGYALALGEPPAPRKAEAISLSAQTPVNEAFKAVVFACLAQLQANEDGMLEGRDAEYLHQMRVALRRLRSALALFRAAFPAESLQSALEELKWLAGRLGPARDWDVFLTETLPRVKAPPSAAGVEAFRRAAEQVRAQALTGAHDAVQSSRYQEVLLDLGAWLAAEPWLASADAEVLARARGPVAEFARDTLERLQRRVRKRGRGFEYLSPAERHRVRIAAKRLRYAGEFFSALYPPKPARRYLRALSALQDVLGALNDAATTERLVRETLAGAGEPAVAAGAGFIEGWVAADAEHRAAHAKEAWKKFIGGGAFWK